MRVASMENSETCQIEILVTPVTGLPGPAEAELCGLLRQTVASRLILTAHPRTLITLSVYVQSDDGGVGALAVNAAMLALVNARVPMKSLVSAVTLGLYRGALEEVVTVLDVEADEEREAYSHLLAVYTAEEIREGGAPTALTMRGGLSEQQLRASLEATRVAAASVLERMRRALKEDVLSDAKTSFSTTLTNLPMIKT